MPSHEAQPVLGRVGHTRPQLGQGRRRCTIATPLEDGGQRVLTGLTDVGAANRGGLDGAPGEAVQPAETPGRHQDSASLGNDRMLSKGR